MNPVPEPPHIRLVEVTRIYGGPTASVAALQGASLEVRRGERLALLGKSGSGKSTILNILGGLDRPTAGVVEAAGRDLATLDARGLAEHRLRAVGMVFQSFNLISSRSALENVELPLLFAGRPAAERRARAAAALAAVGLAERVRHRPTELSGGEAQRVAIARALINEPEIVLADEPTGNLDSATSSVVMGLLLDHVRRRGATLILVTHDEELARRSADRIAWVRDGRIES